MAGSRALASSPTTATAVARDAVERGAVNAQLEGADAEDVIAWARDAFGDGLVMSSSFGAHAAAMLHLVSRVAPRTTVVFVDTGYLFPETYRFAAELVERFSLRLHVATPSMTAARQEALLGRLWEQGPEGVERYLQLNKVEPMQRALRELGATAWIAALRREQTDHRRGLDVVSVQDGRAKIHPMLRWTLGELEDYLDRHMLPRHPLYAEGYRSIGDVHSTLPTLADQDPRDGRLLGKKRECGLHVALGPEAERSLKSSGL